MKKTNTASKREFLEQMPTKALDDTLLAELQKENINDDMVRMILGILESREADYPIETNEAVLAAVEKFNVSVEKETSVKLDNKWTGILKVASVLIIIGMLLFSLPQVAKAEKLGQILARWTASIFEFFVPGEFGNKQSEYVFETDNTGLQQIYDAVVELGITDPVVPMWVPTGFELKETKVNDEPSEITFYANMKQGDREIFIFICKSNGKVSSDHIKDTQNVDIHEIDGIDHYIITNYENVKATWKNKDIECSVVTDCQEDLYKILKSIYTTEVQ